MATIEMSTDLARMITSVLPIGKGGTGQNTALMAFNALAAGLGTATGDFNDTTYFITTNNSGATNDYYRRSYSILKGNIKTYLTPNIITSIAYSGDGNAVTALSLTKAGVLTVTKGATYNNYSLPLASSSVRGGAKIGYTTDAANRNYAVQLSNEQMYVNVPWTDHDHYAWTDITGRPTIDKTTVIYQISRGSSFDPIQSGYWAGMTTQSGIDSNWWHVLSMDWSGNDANNWISQLAIPTDTRNGIYYRTRHNSTTNTWIKCLDANNYTSYTVTKTGSGASGTWGINISGNAATATQLQTARTIWGQSFNGTGNVNGNLTQLGSEVRTASSSVVNFLTSNGSALNAKFGYLGLANTYADVDNTNFRLDVHGPIRCYSTTTNNRVPMNSGLTGLPSYGTPQKYGTIIYSNGISMRDPYTGDGNDCAFIRHVETTSNSGYLEIGVGDDGSEEIVCRQYNTSSSVVRTLTLLDASGNTQAPGVISGYDVRASRYVYTTYTNQSCGVEDGTISCIIYDNGDGWLRKASYTHLCNNLQGNFLRYNGWWNSGSGQSVDNAHGMIFAYGDHGAPGSWGIVTTFDYQNDSNYRHQIFGDGWNSEMYFRVRSSDRGGWYGGWKRLIYDGTGHAYIGSYNHTGYALSTSSFICGDWVRTTGATGWYNESYGGGVWMSDSTWVRVYNGKGFHVDNTIEVAVNGYPSVRLQRTDGGEVSQYFINNTAGWAVGINVWGIGAGQFGIGQYSGTGGSTWRFRIDNSGYCYTSSYLNLGAGNEQNASSPPVVWGLNGGDTYLRTYQTTSLYVKALANTGYGNYGLTYYQTDGAFDGNSGWCHYIIGNHGDGASYYHYTLGLPFWGPPIYRRQTGSTSSVTKWYKFWTEENLKIRKKTVSAGSSSYHSLGLDATQYLVLGVSVVVASQFSGGVQTYYNCRPFINYSTNTWYVFYYDYNNARITSTDSNARIQIVYIDYGEDGLIST